MAERAPAEDFDAVVIGSGFGGSVAAWRLTRENKDLKVCVLERGRPYPPGSFQRTPHGLRNAFWEPDEGKRGLYDVWSFGGVRAIVASGLGGGSLIYANVLLRKDPATFVRERLDDGGRECWPITYDELEPHYEAIEAEIRPERYPIGHAPYSSTPKTRAIAQAFESLELQYEHPPLAVRFAPNGGAPRPQAALEGEPENVHKVQRLTCRLCGECDVGCNDGAKSTMDLTLLSAAWRAGAQVRTLCDVKTIRPVAGGRYEVEYEQDVAGRDGHPDHLLDPSTAPEGAIRARIVVVAAGALGSTRLLLNNRVRLQGLSPTLGTRFSANGDLLSFALDCREGDPPRRRRRDRRPWRALEPQLGPVITTTARITDRQSDSGREMLIQDGGQPAIANWGWQARDMPKIGIDLVRNVWWRRKWAALTGKRRDTSLGEELSRAFGDGRASNAMLPMLGMGRDIPGGRLYLSGDTLQCNWNTEASSRFYDELEEQMRLVSRRLGGRPVRADLLQRLRVVCVHPLGGCPMGDSWREGVVDEWGEVFGHPGVFVTDGAAMPGAVGANPSLTISAFSHRSAGKMLERLG